MSTQVIAQPQIGFMDFSRIDAAFKCSEMIARSTFCPMNFKNKPGDVLCAIQYGFEIGLSPMQAVQSIAVINGKPSIYGDGLMALCQSFSECEGIEESFDETTMTASCRVKRKGRSDVVYSWGKEDAEKAKLWTKEGPWRTYPKRMLQMRARGFALRDAFADRLKGIITAEEAKDYPPEKEVNPRHKISPISPHVSVSREILPVSQPEPVCEATRNHLVFLIQETQVDEITKAKWFKKANASDWKDFNEYQATQLINMLEKKHPEAAEAWVEMVNARNEYAGDDHEQG